MLDAAEELPGTVILDCWPPPMAYAQTSRWVLASQETVKPASLNMVANASFAFKVVAVAVAGRTQITGFSGRLAIARALIVLPGAITAHPDKRQTDKSRIWRSLKFMAFPSAIRCSFTVTLSLNTGKE